ncbi:MAG: hypothetical protein U0163_14915 [Gemmatimonadaceae bacterium]
MTNTRTLRLTVGALAFCALSGAGCRNDTTAPTVSLAYAAAMQSCGPADGPAVTILLSENADVTSQSPSYPLVRVMIWRSLAEARGKQIVLTGDNGFAGFVPSTNGEAAVASGSITLDAGTNAVTGMLDLTFPNRAPLRGRFAAVWLERTILCG